MPTPEKVALQIVKNGGAPSESIVTAAFGDTIVLKLGNSSGVKKVKYRIWEFPDGFALPGGWTQEAANVYSVVVANGANAPAFTLPANGDDLRGKYFFDAEVNDRKRNGRIDGELYGKARLKIPFLTALLEDVGWLESDEFDTDRQYVTALKRAIRRLDQALFTGGGVTDHGALSGLSNIGHHPWAELAARPLSAYTGASNAAVLADARKHITTSHPTACGLTIPTNASVPYGIGTLLMGVNIGVGALALTPAGGVTLNGAAAIPRWGWWWAKKVDTDVWDVFVAGGTGLVVNGTKAAGRVVKTDGTDAFWADFDAYAITAFAATTPVVRVGATVANPAFTAAHNHTPSASLLLTNTDNVESKDVKATPTSFASAQSYTKTNNNASVGFTLTGSDGVSPANRSAAIAWRPDVYWGTGASGFNTEAQIEALANSELLPSRVKTFAVNAAGSTKIYFACPASYGTPTFTVGGFSGGFTLVSASISVTNVNGVTQNYQLWESDTPGLGPTTVAVT